MTANYREVFPDYDPATLPSIPAHWVDNSWRNDACPWWVVEKPQLHVYVNYLNPADREIPATPRFFVLSIADATLDHVVLESDDWAEVLALVSLREAVHA